MSFAKKLVLSLSIFVTMMIALVVGVIGNANISSSNEGKGADEVVNSNTTRIYQPGEVTMREGGDTISYSYVPSNNARSSSAVAYEYVFGSTRDELTGVNLKAFDTTGVNVNYAFSNEQLDENATITGSSNFSLQKLTSKGSKVYIYIILEPEDQSSATEFTTDIRFWFGDVGSITITNSLDGTVSTKDMVKGQEIDSMLAPTLSSGYKFEGWYFDAECTQPVPTGFTSMGLSLFAKIGEAALEPNLPSDWIAWDENSSSYQMIDPYGHYYDEEEYWAVVQATPGDYTRLPEDLIIPEKYNDGVHGEAFITSIPSGWYDDDWGGESIYNTSMASHVKSVRILAPLTNIPHDAFAQASGLTSVTLPDTITEIGSQAFYVAQKLTIINFPANLETIGSYAFADMTMGDTLDLSACTNLETIGDGAFQSNGITNVIFPDGLKTIGHYSFMGTSLREVTLPYGLQSIGNEAFNWCENLTSIVISANVTSVGNTAFYCCYNLVEVYNLSSLNITVGSSDNGYVSYYAAVVYTSLDDKSEFVVIDNVKYLKKSSTDYVVVSLEDNNSVASITLHENTTYIRARAFAECDNLTSVDLNNCVNLTNIGAEAFYYCDNITSIVIPANVRSIGDSAFYVCYALGVVYNLSNFTITAGANDNGYAGYYAGVVKTSLDTENKYETIEGVTYYKESATSYIALGLANPSSTSVTLHANTTAIRPYAFHQNTTLTSVNLSNCTSLTTIGNYAFSSCTSLTSVTLSSSLTIIGKYAFNYCKALTSITIPASVKNIGYFAFYNSGLTSATFNQTSGWYYTTSATSAGKSLTLTNTSTAASRLKDWNYAKFWYNTKAGGSYTDYVSST